MTQSYVSIEDDMNEKTDLTVGREKIQIDRLNAFSDGVLAIVITILVLGIDIPENHDFNVESLIDFFVKLEPSLIA